MQPTPGREGKMRQCLLAFALLVSCFTEAQSPRRLVVAAQKNNPPYEYTDAQGKVMGYTVDVMRAVAQQEGLDLEIRSMAWRDVRGAFERGEVDAVTGMVFSDERAKIMEFTIPHSYVPYVIVTRIGDNRIRSERDLSGKDILVLGRSIIAEHLTAVRLPFQGVETYDLAVQALAAGRGDAAIIPKYTFLFYRRDLGLRNLQMIPSEIYPTKRCFAVRKGDAELLAKLNEGLFLIKQNGKLDALHFRYFGSLEASEIPFRVSLVRSLKILIPSLLGLGMAGFVIWSIVLKRQVNRRTAHLQAALDQVKQLSGLIPICASCKKIRDDAGYWHAVEGYISKHTDATFTHGLCNDCVEQYFPGVRTRREESGMDGGLGPL